MRKILLTIATLLILKSLFVPYAIAINCFGCFSGDHSRQIGEIEMDEPPQVNATKYGLTMEAYNWAENFTDTSITYNNSRVQVVTKRNLRFENEITRINPDAKLILYFEIEFSPDEWVLKKGFRGNFRGVYASDITSYQYIKAREKYPAILSSNPKRIKLGDIQNSTTSNYLRENYSLLKTDNAAFLNGFKNTVHGKRVNHLLTNFNFSPGLIEVQDINNETNVIINILK